MTADDLVRLHGAKQFRHSEELFSAIASGACSLHATEHLGELPSCRHFLGIYRGRSKHLQKFTTPHAISLREDCEALCEELQLTPNEPCRGWIFESSERLFFVFEGVENHRILGCTKGVDKRKISDAEGEELWGK